MIKNLVDKDYLSENGKTISAEEIDVLATFSFGSDGFFTWTCGSCGKVHNSRAFQVVGIVYHCDSCGSKNLLVRTDIKAYRAGINIANITCDFVHDLELIFRMEVSNYNDWKTRVNNIFKFMKENDPYKDKNAEMKQKVLELSNIIEKKVLEIKTKIGVI
jgi:transcription elongation factor Elf1